MFLRSFSKINLSLNVNRKLKNGFHNIQSYYCLINLSDQIKIKKIKSNKDRVKFEGKFVKDIKLSNNSILDTLKILRRKKIISNYYSVFVKKRIPVFGGLGGGTSNAAFLCKHLLGNRINENLLNILDKRIGTDIKLFFYNQGFLKSLKKVRNFKKKYKLNFLLVYPNIKCSTKSIYSKVRLYTPLEDRVFKDFNIKSKFIKFLIKKNNDLQPIVENKYPSIKKLLLEISQNKGCYFSRMTGSGSVCYGLFQSEKTAKVALSKLKLKHPKYWSRVAKTI
tara:strand:- start:27 stop:863 length:837 start_codon:yes stop_codon:yes gene_type:complete